MMKENELAQVLEEEQKFLKLLEVLGQYTDKGSVIIFVDKQEHADGLLKAGLAIKNPPIKTHPKKPTYKNPLKMAFLGFFNFFFYENNTNFFFIQIFMNK
jgi:hypothetical protein